MRSRRACGRPAAAAERPLTRPAAWPARLRVAVGSPARAAVLGVGALAALSFGVRLWLATEIPTPWIMIDELVYSELAKSFASSGHFLVRDAPSDVVSVAYPIVIAPAWWLHPMSTTYGVVKAINVLLMTGSVVPLFLWARRLVSPLHGVVAVVLTLLMPSFVYSGMLMTENAFLPAFVLAAYVFGLALERPTLLRQALAFGVILLASFVRLQGLVLLAVLPTAILLNVLFELRAEPRRRRVDFVGSQLRRYWLTGSLLVAGAVLYALWEAAHGRSLSSGLGSYEAVAHGGYSFGLVRHWVLLHFAELPLSVGVLPACALLVLLGLALRRGGTRSESERAFLAVTTAAVAWVVVEVAVFASRFSIRIEERYMFFVAPLLFLAFALWLDRGLPRPPVTTFMAAAVPALLLFTLPFGSLLNVSILSDTFGLVPFLRLSQKVPGGVAEARHFLLAGGIAAGIAFALWPRTAFAGVLLPASVAAFLALSTHPLIGTVRNYSRNLRASAVSSGSPGWVDRSIGSGGSAAFLFGSTLDPFQEAQALWQLEFWNRSLRSVEGVGAAEPVGLPEAPTRIDASGRIVEAATGRPVRERYVVSRLSFGLAGELIAASPPFALYRTSGPLRLAQTTAGVYGDGWMGSDAAFTRYVGGRPGPMSVTLSRQAWSGPDVPGRARITLAPLEAGRGRAVERTWVIHRGASRTFVLPAPAVPFRVQVHIAPTFSPSEFGQPDTRQLGAQVGFRYSPTR